VYAKYKDIGITRELPIVWLGLMCHKWDDESSKCENVPGAHKLWYLLHPLFSRAFNDDTGVPSAPVLPGGLLDAPW